MASDTMRRRTSAGPVLQSEVTDAIQTAFFEELAEVGYGRLSIDAVASRSPPAEPPLPARGRDRPRWPRRLPASLTHSLRPVMPNRAMVSRWAEPGG